MSRRTSRTPREGTEAPARRRFRGLSPEERQQRRRQQLIAAGIEVFGTRGFHGAGVRDLCAAARLTERYFYESFENREALFLAVFDSAVERVRAIVVAAMAASPPEPIPMARTALRAYLETLRDEPRLARILLIEAWTVGADVGNQSMLASRSFADLVSAALERLYPDLQGGSLDAELVATGLVGSTTYLATRWAASGFEEPLDRLLDHCALFYEALAASMATGASR